MAHFLNKGKWNGFRCETAIKGQVIDKIYEEPRRSGEPVFCNVDDTIASQTKPSSQVMHPIEAAYYHHRCASNKLMDAFAQKEFETIGALRTNRVIYPNQIRQQV